jgi:formylglycine-generating enzyme required for sulfatase activity
MGKDMIEKWRFDRALYARYKGRVIWQQFGLEPIEAWEKFLHEQKTRKSFELYEPNLLDGLQDYFDMSHTDVPQEAADLYFAHEKPVCLWTEEEISDLQQQTSAALYGTQSPPARQEMEHAGATPSDSTGPKPLKTMTNTIGMELVWIPPGEFAMGSDGGEADERPVHTVRIGKGFWMSRTEVTQAQYRTIMDARPWYGQLQVRNCDDDPAVYVTWDDADEFCRTLGHQEGKTYRLPTEAEWEYACRAGTATAFSFDDSDSALAEHAWFEKNVWLVGLERAQPVRGKRSNAFGLYDMHGNVWEWCHDWYDPHYYAAGPSTDPAGPTTGAKRVIRGGGWGSPTHDCRSSNRGGIASLDRFSDRGFRIVVSSE